VIRPARARQLDLRPRPFVLSMITYQQCSRPPLTYDSHPPDLQSSIPIFCHRGRNKLVGPRFTATNHLPHFYDPSIPRRRSNSWRRRRLDSTRASTSDKQGGIGPKNNGRRQSQQHHPPKSPQPASPPPGESAAMPSSTIDQSQFDSIPSAIEAFSASAPLRSRRTRPRLAMTSPSKRAC
jgi:hypothetical protein